MEWTRRRNLSGWKQCWRCKGCGRTFTPDDGFLWKHHPPGVVEALSLHLRGMSERDVSDHLWRHHGVRVSPGTVNRWVLEYAHRWRDLWRPSAPR